MPAQKVNKKESTPLNANTFTRDSGYVFNGWNTKADGTGESYADKANVTLSADLTLYAQWYHDQVTVTFYPNGGTGEVTTQLVNTNIPTDLKSVGYTKESYQLAYWTTNPDGTGTRYAKYGQVTINEDISLYAQWIDSDFTIMTTNTTMIGGGSRYTIVDDLTIYDRIVAYYGGATLVLPAGLTLTLPKGIYVNAGFLGALTIQGAGTLIATGLDGNAAIGGDNEAACGPITISGGNIIATGGPDGAAGIGGGYGSACGTITINGGIITATGGLSELEGFGARIGGGAGSVDEGTVSFGTNLVEVSENGSDWSAYDETHRKRYMRVNHVI
ncbi:MAG: InlB B-repeat-containing protein [Spirochaetales bacterium]|nr:InlB B-repeat-containing protein [Spirochaetales bacterium]